MPRRELRGIADEAALRELIPAGVVAPRDVDAAQGHEFYKWQEWPAKGRPFCRHVAPRLVAGAEKRIVVLQASPPSARRDRLVIASSCVGAAAVTSRPRPARDRLKLVISR